MIGMLAFSKAGHDKQEVFMIVAEDKDFVYLCDGRLRTLNCPKKKNKKHIQLIKSVSGGEKPVRDEEIKRAIKNFYIKGGKNV